MEKGQKTAQLSQPLCTTLFWKLFSPPVAPISMPLGESFRLGSERTWKGNFSVGPVANPIKISLFSSRRRGESVGTGMSKCLFWGRRSSCGLWRARQTGGGGGVWRSLFPVWVGLQRRQCEGRSKRTWWWTGRTWGGKEGSVGIHPCSGIGTNSAPEPARAEKCLGERGEDDNFR